MKVAAVALEDDPVPTDAHGIAYLVLTSRQRVELLVGENEGLGPVPPNGAEFNQGLVISGGVEFDRHVLGLVLD